MKQPSLQLPLVHTRPGAQVLPSVELDQEVGLWVGRQDWQGLAALATKATPPMTLPDTHAPRLQTFPVPQAAPVTSVQLEVLVAGSQLLQSLPVCLAPGA